MAKRTYKPGLAGLAQVIFDAYPEAGDSVDCTDETTLAELAEASQDVGDSVFEVLVNEALVGTEDTPNRVLALLDRIAHDVTKVRDAVAKHLENSPEV